MKYCMYISTLSSPPLHLFLSFFFPLPFLPTCRWRRDKWEIKLMEQPDEHYSLVGGNLVITNPKQKKHAGTYVCVAKNIYGTVISKEATIKFGCERNL